MRCAYDGLKIPVQLRVRTVSGYGGGGNDTHGVGDMRASKEMGREDCAYLKGELATELQMKKVSHL
jgi:hypothetical protein